MERERLDEMDEVDEVAADAAPADEALGGPRDLERLTFRCPEGEERGENGIYWDLEKAYCRDHDKIVFLT